MAKTALRLDSFQTRPGIKPFPFSSAYVRGRLSQPTRTLAATPFCGYLRRLPRLSLCFRGPSYFLLSGNHQLLISLGVNPV